MSQTGVLSMIQTIIRASTALSLTFNSCINGICDSHVVVLVTAQLFEKKKKYKST